jgi:hypothetical protein
MCRGTQKDGEVEDEEEWGILGRNEQERFLALTVQDGIPEVVPNVKVEFQRKAGGNDCGLKGVSREEGCEYSHLADGLAL